MFLPSSGLENHPDGTGDINAIVQGNWTTLNQMFLASYGISASQTGTTITASAPVFQARDVGAHVVWTDGTEAIISVVTDSQHAEATISQTISSSAIEVFSPSATPYEAIARALCKVTKFVSGDDDKIPAWNQSAQKFELITRPGFGFAAGQILFGAGTGADSTSSSSFTWDDSNDILAVVGQGHFAGALYSDKIAVSASTGSTTIDFKLGNLFDVTLSANTTIDASNIKTGAGVWLILRQDATGGRTVAFAAKFKFPNAATPVVYSAANTVTVIYLQASTASELFAFAGFDYIRSDSSPTLAGNFTFTGTITAQNEVQAYRFRGTPAALSYGTTTTIDFATRDMLDLGLTGNVGFLTSNLAAGRQVLIRITTDASIRTFSSFPAWKFIGSAAPATQAASKVAHLRLTSWGTTDADVVAEYFVEP